MFWIKGQRRQIGLDLPEIYSLSEDEITKELIPMIKDLSFAQTPSLNDERIGRICNFLDDKKMWLEKPYRHYNTDLIIPKHAEVLVDTLLDDLENLYYMAKRRLNTYIFWFILKFDERYHHHKWKVCPYEAPTILNVFGLSGNYPEWVVRGDVSYRYNPLEYCSLTGTVRDLPAVTECVLHKHKNGDVTFKRMNGTYTSDEVTIKNAVHKMNKAIKKYYKNMRKWHTEDYKGYKDSHFNGNHAGAEYQVLKEKQIAEHAIYSLQRVLVNLSAYMVDAKLNTQLAGTKYINNDLLRVERSAEHTSKRITELFEKMDETLNLCAFFNRAHWQKEITREELAQVYKHSSASFANERYDELTHLKQDRLYFYKLKLEAA